MCRGVILIFTILTTCAGPSYPAFERAPGDAESGALADAGTGQCVEYGRSFGNPAHLAWVRGVPLRATTASLYGIQSLGWKSLWGGRRFAAGAMGAGVAQFGGGEYREVTLATSLALRSGKLGYGIRARALVLDVAGVESRWSVVFDLGVLERLGDRFAVGLLVGGLCPRRGSAGEALARPRLSLGWAFLASEGTVALLDVEQGSGEPRRVRSAVEISIGPGAVLRAGRMTEPGETCAGLGVRKGRVGVDASVQWHAVLGFSYRTSVLFGLREERSGEERGLGTRTKD